MEMGVCNVWLKQNWKSCEWIVQAGCVLNQVTCVKYLRTSFQYKLYQYFTTEQDVECSRLRFFNM